MNEYNAKRDYYKILGVNKSVSMDHIKQARSKLALKYHPDTNRAPEAVNKFRDVQEAYKVLSDTSSRRQYDIDNNLTNRNALKSVNWSKGVDSDGGIGGAASVEMFRKRHAARKTEHNSTAVRSKLNRRQANIQYGNQHSPQSISSTTKPIQRTSYHTPRSMAGGAIGGLLILVGIVTLLAVKKPVDQLNSNIREKLGK